MKIDFHAHTAEGSSCSTVSADDTIKKLISLQFDAILLTDHESIEGFLSCYNKYKDKIKIFCGFEFSTTLGDMLCILPENKCFKYEQLSPLKLIERVHSDGGVIGIAHPFRDWKSIAYNVMTYEELYEIAKKCDFIETYNSRANIECNKKADLLADKINKFKVQGSDSHSLSRVGNAFNIIPDNISTNKDLIDYIKSKNL